MKTKLLLLFLVLAMTRMIGQNYYKITFSGNPQNVFVQNITQSKSVSLPGTDTLLLKFKGTSVLETDREHQKLTIYPNPMDQSCSFDFENLKPGKVIIQVFNANGSLIHKYIKKLPQGIQHFQLSGVHSGVYVIDIKTMTGHYSGSFVSTDKSNTAFLLMNNSNSQEETVEDKKTNSNNNSDITNLPLEYRNTVELDFATGDQLMFVGYSNGFENDTVYTSPTGNQTITFAFCAKPAQPSAISGNNNPCQNYTGLIYSVTNVTGVSYSWTVPSGWSITSGQGSNSITVTTGTSAGNITVTPSNTCGTGPANTIAVTTHNVPAQASGITGIYNPCRGATGVTYTVNNIAGVTYTWSVPSDWTITSGQGTSSMAVTVGNTNGNITVIPSNDCGNGTSNSFAVIASTEPMQPSAISGKENPCQNSSEVYSVINVPGMNYTWIFPSDWTITAGQNTNSITVTVGIITGNITVAPSNGCGTGPSRSLAVTTQSGGAGQPSAITGNNNPCQGSTGLIYSVNNVAGLTYTWTVPSGWIITSGQGTNSITVTAGIETGNLTVTPSNDCGNGPSNSIAVSTYTVPAQPSEISGTNNPCPHSEEYFYSVTEVSGVNYFWTLPTGWHFITGQNTANINVYTGSEPGNITVTPSNDCGNGTPRILSVTMKEPPAQPSEISGNINPCQGTSGLIYSVVIDPEVIMYDWDVPMGWTITSGQSTSSITVTSGNSSGNISVTPEGECGQGPARTLAITTKLKPAQPSYISGNGAPCETTPGHIYSVTEVSGVTYTWTVPSDWTITAGQGTNSITVTVGFDWGNIIVTPSNNCGLGPASSLSVTTQTIPTQPSAISGSNNPCQGTTGLIYSVFEESNIVYTWSVPNGWTITSGQNTHSITVTAGSSPGNITVTPSNDCGTGPSNSLAITTQTIPAQPSAIAGIINPCQGTTGLIYSVTNVPGVVYSWDVPSGWNITSGQEESTITVTSGTASGNITVIPFNECGEGPAQTLFVSPLLIPTQPSAITGNNNPCQGATGLTYSVINIAGVTYTWSVPSGWSITAGQNTNSISVTSGTASGNISVVPSNDCGNGTSQTLAVTTHTVPAQPSTIAGNNNPCQNTSGQIYSVSNVSGVTYTWSVPSGWSITAGQNTNSISVTSGTASGNISIAPSNDCGNGTSQTLAVTTHTIPAQPSAITGNNNPCQGATGLTYTVTNVSGVTYTWSVPSGWTITAGQGTSSITASASTTSGNISVTPSNDCGTGSAQTLAVTVQLVPAQPSAITGNNNPCQGATGLTYTVTNVSGVTYTWSVPSGWTITAGQSSNSITVTAGTTSGNISVTPSNTCGNGTAQTLAVTTQTVPAQPSAITGNNNPCQGATGLNYSVTNVAGVTYTWSVPSGWNITAGQNTNNITVTAGSASGNITVTPSNTCGTGTASTLTVTTQTVPAQPSAISGNNNPCQGTTGLSYSVTNTSGVTYTWAVPTSWTLTAGQGTSSITVTAGSSAGNITVIPSNTCGNGTASTLAVTTQTVPSTPTTGTHIPSQTQIVWNWSTAAGATGYKYNTVNNYATATDNSTSTTYTQSGLTCNTAYTLYVWAYNTCGNSTVLQLSQTTSACSSGCGPVTFTYNGSTVTYGSVTSAGGRCWLDRNLGATQVATSSTDAASYGDLFQWGRLDDGHQVRTSGTTTTLSNSDVPGHNLFIKVTTSPYDWRSPQNANLWQGVSGINNPCPTGYRPPTDAEWSTELTSWGTPNAAGAFASPLKLPMAGFRVVYDGTVSDEGSGGGYWSSTVSGAYSWSLAFSSGYAFMGYNDRANGLSVRCIKD